LIVILFLSVSNSNITPFSSSSSSSFSFSLTLISYDPLSSCLVDFRGRAHMASVKNMQLVQSDPLNNYPTTASAVQEEMLRRDGELEFSLQLGKVSEKNGFKLYFCRLNNLSFFSLSFFLSIYLFQTTEECFNLDYRGPLSLLQAFAICIARFDAKLQW
jgi:hypothetical protein